MKPRAKACLAVIGHQRHQYWELRVRNNWVKLNRHAYLSECIPVVPFKLFTTVPGVFSIRLQDPPSTFSNEFSLIISCGLTERTDRYDLMQAIWKL